MMMMMMMMIMMMTMMMMMMMMTTTTTTTTTTMPLDAFKVTQYLKMVYSKTDILNMQGNNVSIIYNILQYIFYIFQKIIETRRLFSSITEKNAKSGTSYGIILDIDCLSSKTE